MSKYECSISKTHLVRRWPELMSLFLPDEYFHPCAAAPPEPPPFQSEETHNGCQSVRGESSVDTIPLPRAESSVLPRGFEVQP